MDSFALIIVSDFKMNSFTIMN